MSRKAWIQALMISSLIVVGCGDDSDGDTGADSTSGPGTSSGGPTSTTNTTTSAGTTTAATGSSSDGGSSGGSGSTGSSSCEDASPDIPTARGEMAGVWDPNGQRLVFFGGDQGPVVSCLPQTDFVAETWAFNADCSDFELLDAGSGPTARGRFAVAHDGTGHRMLVHGGRFRPATSGAYTLFDDLWALDLDTDTWTQLTGPGPSPRSNHTAVAAGDRLVVYGGNASTNGLAFTPLGDVWAYDLANDAWSAVPIAGPRPADRLFHAAAVSDDGTTMYVYGGGDENAFIGPFFTDLWALDIVQGTWSRLHDGSGTAPDGRIWPNLALDAPRNRLLMWAGHDDGALGNTNEIWAFDLQGSTWERIEQGDVLNSQAAGFCDFPADFVTPDLGAPERRNAAAAAVTDDALLVFGGKTDCGHTNDVWSWSLADHSWTNLVPASEGEICLRTSDSCSDLCQ